ncbi:MAG TPA: UDP-N-acetylglucosamine 2-epimerase (non-hydrolyzing) [candidate division Zixibacteria bacterium]|nr:UDP-N-acetylglucosamine 2-epimerase (non-hydrolyzing) [candidate division Zixibacteria bacterium]
MPKKILLVIGTRADAIKMAPIIEKIKSDSELESIVVATSQHREMLDQVLESFDLGVDYDLDIMRKNQTLSQVTVRAIEGLEKVFAEHEIAMTVVQGDTSTSFVGGLISFYNKVPVAHIEAGLRTFDLFSPFPEEANRKLLDAISSLLFPPTETAKKHLLDENLPSSAITVTGNTAIDSLLWVTSHKRAISNDALRGVIDNLRGKLMLVTAHRRESFGQPFQRLLRALIRIVQNHPEAEIIYPVHLNPNVDVPVRQMLNGVERIHLLPPLDYMDFTMLMSECDFILTDSGGVQEEAPTLGKPVVVLRDVTERPEGIEHGIAKLVGTDEDAIVDVADKLLSDEEFYKSMSKRAFLYGDGKASDRIHSAIRKELGMTFEPVEPFVPKIL